MSDPVKENRALFCGFCQLHGLNVLNSQYSTPPSQLITYKGQIHIGENEQINGPPFNALKYGQIDYWLVNDEGKELCWISKVEKTSGSILIISY